MAKMYSVYETKARLSEILRLVKSGKEVVVSERGVPIAKILPFKEEEQSFASRMDQLKQSGQVQTRKKAQVFEEGDEKKPGLLSRFLKERD